MDEEYEKRKNESVKHINFKGQNIYLLEIPEHSTKDLKVSSNMVSYKGLNISSRSIMKFITDVKESNISQLRTFNQIIRKLPKKFDKNITSKITDKESYILKCYLQQLREMELPPSHPLVIQVAMMIITEFYIILSSKE